MMAGSARLRLVQLPDQRWVFARLVDGLPTFGYGQAPEGLATHRQLRTAGLRPGGQEPVARIVWHRGRRFAWLYLVDRAAPKRQPSPAQLAALDRAMAARRFCRVHHGYVDHCVIGPDRACAACFEAMPDAAPGQRWPRAAAAA
jgi:hypothetical protein